MEKSALHNNLTKDKHDKINKKMIETFESEGSISLSLNDPEAQKRLDELRGPIDEQFRLEFQNQAEQD